LIFIQLGCRINHKSIENKTILVENNGKWAQAISEKKPIFAYK
jgi:hypothetical protein